MKRKSMKKFVLLCAIFVMIFAGITVSAKTTYKSGSSKKTYTGSFYKMYYENKLTTDNAHPALLIHGNIMIPYKYCMVSRGPKVQASYNSVLKRLILKHNGTTLKMYVNKKYMYVNGKKKTLYTAPLFATVNGKKYLYIPAKAVCAALDLSYEYVKSKKTIYVSKKTVIPVTTEESQSSILGSQSSTNSGSINNINDITSVGDLINFTAEAFKTYTTKMFIEKMGPIAREDYKKTGVLASVTLAQAINESGWGKSLLAQRGNNLFGMKISLSGNSWAGSSWDGKSYVTINTSEYENGKKITIQAKFRKYPNVAASIADHSAYLANAKNGTKYRYAGLTSTTSYAKQLSILKTGGYCTSDEYVAKLTKLIKDYNLTKYDVK